MTRNDDHAQSEHFVRASSSDTFFVEFVDAESGMIIVRGE